MELLIIGCFAILEQLKFGGAFFVIVRSKVMSRTVLWTWKCGSLTVLLSFHFSSFGGAFFVILESNGDVEDSLANMEMLIIVCFAILSHLKFAVLSLLFWSVMVMSRTASELLEEWRYGVTLWNTREKCKDKIWFLEGNQHLQLILF